jgi:phosphoglycolate phosphatase
MKPNPWPLRQALDELGYLPERVVFIGDSMTDIEVANIVGMPCVAYANKPAKRARFTGAGALVIDSMSELAVTVRSSHHCG